MESVKLPRDSSLLSAANQYSIELSERNGIVAFKFVTVLNQREIRQEII